MHTATRPAPVSASTPRLVARGADKQRLRPGAPTRVCRRGRVARGAGVPALVKATHSHSHSHGHGHSHGHDHGHSHGHGHGHDGGGRGEGRDGEGEGAGHGDQWSAGGGEKNEAGGHAQWPPTSDGDQGAFGPWTPRNPPLARGAGVGKVLFVDAYTAGVAGDMFVAALLDLGVPFDAIETQLALLGVEGYTLSVLGTERSAISAPRFIVTEDGPDPQPLRDFAEIKALLEASQLAPGAKEKAVRAFTLLARGESSVHGVPIEAVHFHEVGAVDSIVDIVAVAVGLDFLGADELVVSPLPMGRGIIRGAAHGPLPSPPPATVSCLCDSGVPTYDPGVDGEFVTPTGASLVGALKTGVARWPDMFLPERCAYGAGTKRWRDRPNLLRLVLGCWA